MKRRHLVVLVSAVTLLTIVFVTAVMITVGVGTDAGRDVIRSLVQNELNGRVRGKVHLGRMRTGVGSFTIDSFAIRDLRDSLLVSTGRVSGEFDIRDIMDRRLLLRNVRVEHPVARIHQHPQGDWNFQRIFRKRGPSAPNVPGRSFGDFVVLDSVRVIDGEFIMTRPWSPDDSLRGAKRDSAIRVNLENPRREIRRSAEGLTHTYRWSHASGFLPRVRLADPDSSRFGQLVVIDSLRVDELEPAFKFSNARGTVRRQGDSVFVDVAHFDLPASTGSAKGKIWWGSGLPVRVDVRIKGDSVSLNDVAWVYATLPRTGGGRTNLHITNNPANIRQFQYALTDMDVRSTKSRLTGGMTFVTGGPVLVVKDVDMRGMPVNFDLVRTLAGGPLSVDWQGALYGMVRGPGGPLTNFVVDTSFVTFRDAHVVGAISQGGGRGELDILDPEFVVFHGFDVNAASIDLRSIQYLFPEFPRIGGTVSGVARLDSLWLDVRFSNANITHRNGPGEPTRVTGNGRVTTGDTVMSYDVAVNAQPLSLTMLSRAYPLGLKGLMSGPIQAKGTTDDLQLTLALEGPAGKFAYTGKVDAYPLSVAARGTGRVDALDLAQILDKEKTPVGFVTGSYAVDIRGDTNDLATLTGSASAIVERSELDGIRVFPSRVRARFADGRIHVDTLRIESVAATITANGALGLKNQTSDSLQYHITVDSLGGLRRYLGRLTSAFRSTATTPDADSLAGSVIVQGAARGSLNEFDLGGNVSGKDVFVRREAGREITGSFTLANLLEGPTGTFHLRFSALNVGGIALDTLTADLRFDAPKVGSFSLAARARNGVTLHTAGDLSLANATTNLLFRQARLVTDSNTWALRGPATVVLQDSNEVTIDSLVLANGRGGRVSVAGFIPDTGRARIMLRADSVPLHDIGRIAQLRQALSGMANVTVNGAGTAAAPTMAMQARLTNVRYGGIQLERVNATADYARRRTQVMLDLASDGRAALQARGSLPMEIRYFGAELLDDSLSATVRTDSASFSIIEALVPGLRNATGRLVANLDVGGTWKHPDVSGPVRVENGEVTVDSLGVRIRGVNVDLGFFGHRDSLAVRRISGWSGTNQADSVSIRGYVAYKDFDDPYLDLRLNARGFRAFDKRGRGRLDVSTEGGGLRLRGQLRGATLTGGLVVDRGVYYLPDPALARKQFADFSSILTDSAEIRANTTSPAAKLFQSVLFDGVRVSLGEDVWMRSPEANIKLAGALNVQRRAKRSASVTIGEDEDSELVPVLDGELRAERGTYTMDLGRVVTREFQVEGGSITFFETAGLSPILNISALHTVRSASTGADIRIRVRLTGPLENPILTLESAESFQMSQSDMVSYLMFGQQNFELGVENKSRTQLAAQILFPSATTFAASQLRGVIGPIADFLQLRPGSADLSTFSQGDVGKALGTSIEDAIVTSRVGGEKQISDKVFVSLSTGLCFEDKTGSTSSDALFIDGLSGRFEYRFSRNSSVKLGKEPAASTCRRGGTGRVVQAPSQWGLSLFKTWRF